MQRNHATQNVEQAKGKPCMIVKHDMYIRLPSKNALFDAWLFYSIRLHSKQRSVAYLILPRNCFNQFSFKID